MPGTTPGGTPYALPEDPLVQWPATSQSVATRIDTIDNDVTFATYPMNIPNMPIDAGTAVTRQATFSNGLVMLTFSVTLIDAPSGPWWIEIPAGARTAASGVLCAVSTGVKLVPLLGVAEPGASRVYPFTMAGAPADGTTPFAWKSGDKLSGTLTWARA